MKLIESLSVLLDSLVRGDAPGSALLVNDLNGRYPVEVRELSGEELARAIELHGKCTEAAQGLRDRLLGQIGDAGKGIRAACAYRAY